MPATMTHQMFALEVIKSSNISMLKSHKDILMLATQGPDPFFFYGMLPWKKKPDKNRIQGIGSYLHHENPHKHLHMLYQKAKESQDDEVIVYAIGAMMHYILDKHVHPYVFSRSGFDSKGRLTKPYNIYHSHMETLMDVQLRHEKHIDAKQLNPHNNIALKHKTLQKIDALYASTYKDLCQKNDFLKASLDMISIYQLVYDRYEIKRSLLKTLLGKDSHPYAISHPRKLKGIEAKDVLNLNHIPWRHPETGDNSSESVTDLFDKALKEMLNILDAIGNNAFDESYPLGIISYDGMQPNKTMTHQTMMFPLNV